MALQVRRASSIKVRIVTTLMMVFALVAQPLYGFVVGQIAYATGPTTVVVNALTGQGWELTDTRSNGHVKLIADHTAPGAGALNLRTDLNPVSGQDKAQFINRTMWFNQLNLSTVASTGLSYSTKQNSATFEAGLPSYQMEVNLNGANGYTTLVYEPYNNEGNAAVHAGEWQSWNVGTGKLWSSRTVTSSTDSFVFQASQGQYQYTLSDILAHFPNAKVLSVGVNVGSNNPGYDTEVDSLAFNNKIYNFEPIMPTASDSAFAYGSMYVRENNIGDNTAQVRVPAYATDVRFVVGGQEISDLDINTNDNYDNDIYKVSGAANGSQWYRLQKSLQAGEHTITAKFYHDGIWYAVTGSAYAFAIDTPWAEYVLPQANKVFRPNDKVVRLKIDDQFNQFKSMNVAINSAVNTVLRSACVDQGDYVLCDVQGLNLPEGIYAASTTVYTQANNRHDNLLSQQFKVDATAPTVTSLDIENDINGVVGDEVKLSASASDAVAVESVNFYATKPRADGVCDGNGAKYIEQRKSTIDSDGKYRVALTNNLDGEYCMTAVSRDTAMNNSAPAHAKMKFDNTAPLITLTSPANNTIMKGASLTQSWSSNDADIHHYEYESYNNEAMTDLRHSQNMYLNTSKTASNVGNATFWWRVKAVDNLGHTTWSEPRKLTIDNNKPTAVLQFAAIGDASFKVKFNEDVNKDDAEDPSNYFLENWLGAGGSGDLVGDASVAYDTTTKTATVNFTNSGWYVSPEQKWGVKNIRDLAGNVLNETSEYSTPLGKPAVDNIDGVVAGNSIAWSWTGVDPESSHISGAHGASGIKLYEYQLVKAGDQPTANDWITTSLVDANTVAMEDAEYTLHVRAIDNASNVGDVRVSNSVLIDTLAPELTIEVPVQNIDGTYRVSGTTTDPGAPVSVKRNGVIISNDVNANADGAWTVGLGELIAGNTYVITADSVDSTGNIAAQKSNAFNVTAIRTVNVPFVESSVNTPTPLPQARSVASVFATNSIAIPETQLPSAAQNAAVLGTQDKKTETPLANTGAIAPSAEGWRIFGMAWFWWLAILAAAVAGWLWLAAAIRRSRGYES